MKTPLYIQIKYAKLFGTSHLPMFGIKNHSPFLATGRCHVCGDSQQSRIKARFYIYEKQGSVGCYCHNCGFSASVESLLRGYDEFLYRQLLTERFTVLQPIREETKKEPKVVVGDGWKDCLTPAHFAPKAVKYLQGRMVPKEHWNRVFFTNNLKHTYVDVCDAIGIEVDTTKKIPEIEGIFMPFYDKDGHLTFSTTRNINPTDGLRYATIEFAPSYKLFGMERVDAKQKIRVVEGPIDSFFIKNCLATGDASLDRAAQCFPKDKLVLVPDNEPRAPVQLKRIEKFIEQGYNVVLFPHHIKSKDPNDIVQKDGLDVNEIIELNTFQGLKAKLKFKEWRLCE